MDTLYINTNAVRILFTFLFDSFAASKTQDHGTITLPSQEIL